MDEKYISGNSLEGIIHLKEAIPLGIQHVLAMFAGNLTPILIVCGVCGIASGSELEITLIQNAMIVAGIVTIVQNVTIGPVGAKLPVVMGTSSSLINAMISIANQIGGGVYAYGSLLGASIIGGLFESVIGLCFVHIKKLFVPIVSGLVILTIGLSLIPVGVNEICGGMNANDFGSFENLFVSLFVIVVIIYFRNFTKGFTSTALILIGIIAGYVLVSIMACILPTTIDKVLADGTVEKATKDWVLEWDVVKNAAIFNAPKIMPVKINFDMKAILPMILMFIVTTVETVGDITGIAEGGFERQATDKELTGGIICDGLGSSLAAIFGVLPNTTFSQNVGLVAMTKVVNLFVITLGGIFLILCGTFPKIAAIISIIPSPVLGGAAILMFTSIVVSGMSIIVKEGITNRNITIISVALGIGYGFGLVENSLNKFPESFKVLFGSPGLVPVTLIAIILNTVLPKEKS